MKALTGKQIGSAFIMANIITQFLFFIDEGYSDFRWMKDWGNWVVYLMYVLLIWGLSLGLRWMYNLICSFVVRIFK